MLFILRVGFMILLFSRLVSLWRILWVRRGKGVRSGAATSYEYVKRYKGNVEYVRLTYRVPRRLRFVLRPEREYDRFAKRWGLAREWQTGDIAFDNLMFVICEDPALLERLSDDAHLRKSILDLFRVANVKSIRAAHGWLSLELSADGEKEENEAVCARARVRCAEQLAQMRRQLEAVADREPTANDRAFRRQAWLVGFIGLLSAVGLLSILSMMHFDHYQVVYAHIHVWSAVSTAACAIALGVLTFALLGGTSLAHRVLLDVALAALPAAWLASVAGFTWYNESGPQRAAERRQVQIDRVYVTRRRRSNAYWLVVRRWPDARGAREIEIWSAEFEWLANVSCADVFWNRGALGDGWVSAYAISEQRCGERVER